MLTLIVLCLLAAAVNAAVETIVAIANYKTTDAGKVGYVLVAALLLLGQWAGVAALLAWGARA